jgi:hypothetical protein
MNWMIAWPLPTDMPGWACTGDPCLCDLSANLAAASLEGVQVGAPVKAQLSLR